MKQLSFSSSQTACPCVKLLVLVRTMEHMLFLDSKLETSSSETEGTKAENVGKERHYVQI